MSFTLTYAQLANPNFVAAVRKLSQFAEWDDPKKLYNAARISSLLDQELKTFYDLRQKNFKKWKARVPENNEDPTEADKAALEEMKVEADKFGEVSFGAIRLVKKASGAASPLENATLLSAVRLILDWH